MANRQDEKKELPSKSSRQATTTDFCRAPPNENLEESFRKKRLKDSTKNTVNLFVQYSPSFEQQRPRSPPLSSAKLFGLETVEEEDEPLDMYETFSNLQLASIKKNAALAISKRLERLKSDKSAQSTIKNGKQHVIPHSNNKNNQKKSMQGHRLHSKVFQSIWQVQEADCEDHGLPRIFTCHKCDKSGFCLNCLELHLKWSKKCGDDPLPDASSTESESETESSDSNFTSETSGDKQFSEENDGNESDAEKLHRIKDFVPQILPFSTGLPALDQHVMLKPGVMVTVVGGQGCGRKEFSYCTIAEALHANNSGIIFYISYKGGFNPLRLIEILHHRFGPVSEDEVQNALKRVVSPVVPQNVEGLYKWLYEFEKKYKDINVILLIVDHIGLYLWETYDSMVDYRAVGEHNQIVIYSLFQKLNQKFGILYTTHVKGWDSSKMLPAGGSIFWNKKMTTNIFLIRHVRMFQAQIYKMVDMKRYISTSRVFTFYLSRKGITNSQFESQEEPSEWWKYAPKSPESNGLNRTELWERFNNMFEHSDNDAGNVESQLENSVNAPVGMASQLDSSDVLNTAFLHAIKDIHGEKAVKATTAKTPKHFHAALNQIQPICQVKMDSTVKTAAQNDAKYVEDSDSFEEDDEEEIEAALELDVEITGIEREKEFSGANFTYKNVVQHFDTRKTIEGFDEINTTFPCNIILELLNNFYLNIYNHLALAAPEFFEHFMEGGRKSDERLKYLFNYEDGKTRSLIGLLPDYTVFTLELKSKELIYYNPFDRKNPIAHAARFRRLQDLLPHLANYFNAVPITVVNGSVPLSLMQDDSAESAFVGCLMVELLIKFETLPQVAGLNIEKQVKQRYQSWLFQIVKYDAAPVWSSLKEPHFFQSIKRIHHGFHIDPPMVLLYMKHLIKHHGKEQSTGILDPAFLEFVNIYPTKLILEKFALNVSNATTTLLIPVELTKNLYVYGHGMLKCFNSIKLNERNAEWQRNHQQVVAKIAIIIKAVYQMDIDEAQNVKMKPALFQQNHHTATDTNLFIIKYATLKICNQTQPADFKPADIRKLLKIQFPINIIDANVAKKASSSKIGIKKFMQMIGFEIQKVKADGNSFYQAVAVALRKEDGGHRALRTTCYCWIRGHPEECHGMLSTTTIEKHLANQAINNYPPEAVDIYALSCALNRSFLILQSGRSPEFINPQYPEPIVLARKDHPGYQLFHFDVIVMQVRSS